MRASDGGKEILQVHFQDDALAQVGRDESVDGPAFYESMGGRMRRNLVKNLREYFPLQILKPQFGRFNQSNGAGFFRQDAIVIVPEAWVLGLIREPFQIREPEQFIDS